MWETDELGLATWVAGDASWSLNARGGDAGIAVLGEDGQRLFEFAAVEDDQLPVADEQFVRRDQWHVNFPQGESSYALRMVFRPLQVDAMQLVLESTVSIQTSLLDTHPKIDLNIDCRDIDSFVPDDPSGDNTLDTKGSAPISVAKNRDVSIAVLLGPHDSPFTTNHSTDTLLRLRLFGDFLEKGVIRRARPWVVIDRSGETPSEEQLTELYRKLCGSPLPLS
ncbi:MAG: hypothetical protein AAGI63_13975 [Planctomycetota bacterium]